MTLEVLPMDKNVTRPNPILFVHGAWHAAWCWEKFLPYFAKHGYASYAVSLSGHGNSDGRDRLWWLSAAGDYVTDVTEVVQGFASPPILVGHSMGGYVVQKYLEKNAAAAGILLASIPVTGIFGFAIRLIRHYPRLFLKAHVALDPGYILETEEMVRTFLFSPEVTEAEIYRHYRRLQSESFRMELDTLILSLPRPKNVLAHHTPISVLAAENDRVFSLKEEQCTARAYGTQAEIFPNMAHDMMLEPNWEQVAEHILGWLNKRGL
jgi:pimeloyl-ACP methyl ester carboxylesterase